MRLYHKAFFIAAILVILLVPFKSMMAKGRMKQRQCYIREAVTQQGEAGTADIEQAEDEADSSIDNKSILHRVFIPFLTPSSNSALDITSCARRTSLPHDPRYILIRSLRI